MNICYTGYLKGNTSTIKKEKKKKLFSFYINFIEQHNGLRDNFTDNFTAIKHLNYLRSLTLSWHKVIVEHLVKI